MGLDHSGFSPRVQQKVVYAGVNSVSFRQASRDLAKLSDLGVAPKPVERMVQAIGRERIDQREAAVAEFERLPLMAKDTVADPERPCPAVAMVSIDGGRLQMRSAPGPEPASPPTPTPTPTPARASKPERSGHWRESKVAVLETYHSKESPSDPDPDVPRCFLDLARATKLVRGLGHALPVGLESEAVGSAATPDEPAPKGRDRKARPGRPDRLVRSVLASLDYHGGETG